MCELYDEANARLKREFPGIEREQLRVDAVKTIEREAHKVTCERERLLQLQLQEKNIRKIEMICWFSLIGIFILIIFGRMISHVLK